MRVFLNSGPGLVLELLLEEFLEELLEEVPDSLKRLEDQEETLDLWRRYTTTVEFELSVAGGHRVLRRQLLHFLGGTCQGKVTTKWACQSRFSDSYVRLVGSRSSSCISKGSSSISFKCLSRPF